MQEFILKNLITIIFILLLVYGYIKGFNVGLLKKVLSFGSIIVSIFATRFFTPVLSGFIKDVTNIESTLTAIIYDSIIKNNFYDQINIPWLNGSIDTGNIQETIKNGLCTNIANSIINLGCGIVVFLITLVLIKIILKVLDIVDFIPVVGQLNRILGGVFGVCEIILTVWIVFMVLKALENVPQIAIITDNIKSSFIVNYFYNNNFIFSLFEKFFSVFTNGNSINA